MSYFKKLLAFAALAFVACSDASTAPTSERPSASLVPLSSLTGALRFTEQCSGRTCTFDASNSLNFGGFRWSFGDGSTASGVRVTHTFAADGTFYLSLSGTIGTNISGRVGKLVICSAGRCF